MKKIFYLILSVSLLLLSACTNVDTIGKTQSLEEFYKDAQIENVDKVIILDGSTGASKMITNQEDISKFLFQINAIEFTPQVNQEERIGGLYGITLFDGEKEFKFSLNRIDNTYYDSNPDIHPIVDDYYKQLEIEEE